MMMTDTISQIIFVTAITLCIRIRAQCRIHTCRSQSLCQSSRRIDFWAKWSVRHWQARQQIQNKMSAYREAASSSSIQIRFLRYKNRKALIKEQQVHQSKSKMFNLNMGLVAEYGTQNQSLSINYCNLSICIIIMKLFIMKAKKMLQRQCDI